MTAAEESRCAVPPADGASVGRRPVRDALFVSHLFGMSASCVVLGGPLHIHYNAYCLQTFSKFTRT